MKNFITPEFMESIGYIPIPDDDKYKSTEQYFRYWNKGGTSSTFYGPMFREKRRLWFNTDFDKDYIFVQIEEDGGTRKVFQGGIKTPEDLIKILELVY